MLLAARSASARALNLQLEAPLLEVPYNLPYGRFPSMAQSLALSKDFYEAAHGAAELLDSDRPNFWRRLGVNTLVLGFDLFSEWLPLGTAWTHEEFHRAVLGRRGIDSYNGVYDFNLFASSISVYRVKDEDLFALKRDHPAEFVRMASAGIEGERELVLSLEKDAFFFGTRGFLAPLALIVSLNSSAYVFSGTQLSTDDEIRGWIAREPTIPSRDFDGHDFTSWVYDLHRPFESYAARGPHPSGVGIQRYILVEQLTPEELSYLKMQSWLSLLNLLDPWLLGFSGFRIGTFHEQPLRFSANVRHELTPFGFDVALDVFLKAGERRLFVALHNYANQAHWMPGLEAQLLRVPLTERLDGTARAIVWLQPADQLFAATAIRPGALLSARLDAKIFGPAFGFAEIEAKSAGWAAANPYLDANVSARIGATFRL